jgi:hypothetical protein
MAIHPTRVVARLMNHSDIRGVLRMYMKVEDLGNEYKLIMLKLIEI